MGKTIAQKVNTELDEREDRRIVDMLAANELETIEERARRENRADLWDKLWSDVGQEEWRAKAMSRVYDRICSVIGAITARGEHGVSVTDIGGGTGVLASLIVERCPLVGRNGSGNMLVVDGSSVALEAAKGRGLETLQLDLEDEPQVVLLDTERDVFVSTECIEHLSEATRESLLEILQMNAGAGVILSVPNNRLGPDEEPQHTVKFTAIEFKRWLEGFFCDHNAETGNVRVEVLGPYLLAFCGPIAAKSFSLSATLPVRDEGHDLEPTLASLRGVADQLVVGVDPRTKDNTFEVASAYADEVFYLENPEGPPTGHEAEDCPVCGGDCHEYMGPEGINFAWARNQCIDRCTGEWIFMTEGHERLAEGVDVLLSLDYVVPKQARVGFVLRQGNGQQWAFPWLFQNAPDIRFKRPVHNVLDFPEGTYCVTLAQVKTLHDRHHERGASRAKQRKAQNRSALLDDWLSRKSEASLFYLGQEWRDIDKNKAKERLEQFLQVSNNGVQKYQARLILGKEYMLAGDLKNAKRVLHGCTADDWSRCEHFVWLGDVAVHENEFDKARRFYTLAATGIGDPPITVWWIDLMYYSYLPAQRLAMVCGELGRHEEALVWCRRVLELLPTDAPAEAFAEARANITICEGALGMRAEELGT